MYIFSLHYRHLCCNRQLNLQLDCTIDICLLRETKNKREVNEEVLSLTNQCHDSQGHSVHFSSPMSLHAKHSEYENVFCLYLCMRTCFETEVKGTLRP